MTNPVPTPRARRWAIALDCLAAAAFLMAAWIIFTGSLRPIELPFGLQLTISHPQRATLIGLILFAIRHRLDPRHPWLQRIWQRFNGLSDVGERALFWTSRQPLTEFALVTLAYTAFTVVLHWKQVLHPFGVSDLGDPLFSMWRLSWFAHQVTIDPAQLFNTNIYYPEKLTLTYSDSILFQSVLAAPFIWLGVPIAPIYHCIFFAAFVFCGVFAYYLVRALTGRRDAAFVAGAIYGFYPYRFEHYSHLEQVWTVFVPLTLLMLHRAIASGRWRDGIGTGVAYTLQMYSCMYAALYLAVYMVPLAATLWFGRGRPVRAVKALGAGAVLAGVLIWPLATQYIANRPIFGERSVIEIEAYSAIGGDYLNPHERNWLYGSHNSPGHHPERDLFPGLVSITLAVAGFWPPVSVARLGYALAGLVAFDASLGLNGYLYPWLHEYVGAFKGLRVPARFSVFVGMTLAVLAGYGVVKIVERWPKRRVWLTSALLAAALVDVWPRLVVVPLWKTPPPIYGVIPATPQTIVADLPATRGPEGESFAVRYMYFTTFHWHTLVDGNSGWAPPSWWIYREEMQAFPSDQTLEYLRSRGVQYFAVHGAFYDNPEEFTRIRRQLEGRTDIERISTARFAGSDSELYRFK